MELLRDRTIAVRPEFRITDSNRAQVQRLCEDLDALPLAIELAASRLRTLTIDEAANRLADRFGLLASGSRVARPHQRTLRGLIDWSYELCTPAERLQWNRLSVFAGAFGLDAAEAVCAGEGIGPDEVLDLLDRLVVQSVVMPTEHEGMPRYRLLETIRQYGRERLAESGQEEQSLRRHDAFYLALAEHIADSWYGPGQHESLARLRAEHADLRAALERGSDPQATLALAAALRFHWCEGGFLGEGAAGSTGRSPPRRIPPRPGPGRCGSPPMWRCCSATTLRRTGGWRRPERWARNWTTRFCAPTSRACAARWRCSAAGWRRPFPSWGRGGRSHAGRRGHRGCLRSGSDGHCPVAPRGSTRHSDLQAGGRPRRGA